MSYIDTSKQRTDLENREHEGTLAQKIQELVDNVPGIQPMIARYLAMPQELRTETRQDQTRAVATALVEALKSMTDKEQISAIMALIHLVATTS